VSKGENTHTLTLITRAGEPSFVWQEVKMGLLSAGSRLHSVDAATGRAGVLETQLVSSPLMKNTEAAPPVAAVAAVASARTEAPAAVPATVSAAESFPVASQAPAQTQTQTQAQPAVEKPALIPTPTAPAPETKLRPSRFDYEAERAAKEAGCLGPNGERPLARLLAREGVIESFSVQCAAHSLRVRCDMGMCRALP